MYRVVIDTSVLVAALQSRKGASFAILSTMGQGWRPVISVALVLEYEAVLKCEAVRLDIPEFLVDAVIDAFCAMGERTQVHFRFRPSIADPNDEFAVELAVAASADAIVTHNIKDFHEARRFGVEVWEPQGFLERIKTRL